MSDQSAILAAAVKDAAITREVVVATGALESLAAVVARRLGTARALIVADDNTWPIAGAAALRALAAAGVPCAEPHMVRGAPRVKPRTEIAEDLAVRLRESDCAAVAVGSGVINDLVKYASALAGKPYVSVATAASMDGYAASGAALIDRGFKRTLACPPPVAVVADLDILAQAPKRMTGWGYGDLAGKVVAGADWFVADALGVEAINPRPYAMIHDHLATWLAEPERLAERQPDAFAGLLGGLLVSGFAMQAHGNSRPASASDHQFSHLWEMENLSLDGEPAAHGACVGVGCVAMLALYEWLLTQRVEAADIERALALTYNPEALEREIAAAFDDAAIANNARAEMQAKRSAGDKAMRLRRFGEQWPQLRAILPTMLLPAAEMQRRLRVLGGAAHPAELGVSLRDFAADHRRARLIRRRYTVLDLVEDLGWLERAIDSLFAPDGFWGRQSNSRIPHRADPAERVVQ